MTEKKQEEADGIFSKDFLLFQTLKVFLLPRNLRVEKVFWLEPAKVHISLSKLQSHELTFLISDTVNFFHMCGVDDDDNGGLNVGGLLLCMRLLTAGWPTCVNKASADSKSQHCFYTIKSFMAE